MGDPQLHDVVTSDGAMIVGSVHGRGPSVVFIHGSLGDGELDWQHLVAHMADRFTCHLPSRRGRGRTGDHPDHRLARMVEDIVAYVDSLDEPSGLVGWSAGATLSLAAAADIVDTLEAVAVYEPPLAPLMDEQQRAARIRTVTRMGELVAQGNTTDAVRCWAEFVFNEVEVAALATAGYLEAAGRYVSVLLDDIQQAVQFAGPDPTEPDLLARISVPVLVAHGTTTRPFFTSAAQHVADHVLDARLQQIPGAGHAAPITHPGLLATALTTFFASLHRPA